VQLSLTLLYFLLVSSSYAFRTGCNKTSIWNQALSSFLEARFDRGKKDKHLFLFSDQFDHAGWL
jgi:hypothetical protein